MRKRKTQTILLEKNQDYSIMYCGGYFLSIKGKVGKGVLHKGNIALILEGKIQLIGW